MFPVRLSVKPVVALTRETSVPVADVLPQLSFFDESKPMACTGRVRSSPTPLSAADGEMIANAVIAAGQSPKETSIDLRKWNRVPRGYEAVQNRLLGRERDLPHDDVVRPDIEAIFGHAVEVKL